MTGTQELNQAGRYELSHLRSLEAEAIHIIREVAAEFERPVLLFSGGKDSIVMLHLALKAFRPGRLPFPVMHVDTGHNFPEVIEYRDKRVAEVGAVGNDRRPQRIQVRRATAVVDVEPVGIGVDRDHPSPSRIDDIERIRVIALVQKYIARVQHDFFRVRGEPLQLIVAKI